MQITGSYNNYLNLSNLLAPLGVKNSGNLIMGVFASSMNNLKNKIDNQIFSKESAAAINQLGNMVSGLSSKAKKLTLTDMHSVFNDRSAISSDSNVLTASAYDALSPDIGAEEATYNISVAQIAQNQENIGLELNKAGIGVTAKVVAGSGMETQQLVISSDNTGLAAAFSVSDISGNAMAATAVEIVATEAQDAQYTIDGTDYTSGSNTISLDDGLAVQFYNYASRITTDNPFNYAKEADNMDLYSMGQTYSLSAATSKNLLEGTLLNMIV